MGFKFQISNFKSRVSPGFTLIEILIAIFIFTLVASAIFTAYTGTFKIIDESESRADIYEMAGVALERISEDLESAYLSNIAQPPGADKANPEMVLFVGEKKEIGARSCGALRFLSLAHLTFSEEGPVAEPTEIVYYVAAKGEEGLLELYRSDTPLSHERPDLESGGLILCEGLLSIDFTYYDSHGEPHETWDSEEGESKGKLPSRVSISMKFADSTNPDTPYKFMTGVALPMGG
jgi:general secretion pathway protein J